MAIKVRKLLWVVDCEPLGYPGLEVVFWLNPPMAEDEEKPKPKSSEGEESKRDPWDNAYYRRLAQFIEEVRVPGQHTDSGEDEVLVIDGPEAAYALECGPGADPQLVVWAMKQYSGQRQERLKAELKN